MTHLPTSLVDILQWRAKNQPHRLAYRFLKDGELDEVMMTYDELDRRARSIGTLLQSSVKAGDRALLLFPPGLDFIAAFFGCLYAKVIAIPAYPPHPARLEKSLPALQGIVTDAEPAVALITSSLFEVIRSQPAISTALGTMKLLVTDNNATEYAAEKWKQPGISGNEIAFLQYTSGSTSTPRGVMVSHNNLLHNLGLIEKYFGQSQESHAVIWLPPYHDMGLVGGILQPLYTGYPVTLIPHLLFLQRPFRWLQAISRFRATTSGGPNFAYDLCIKKIKPEQREVLDLSCWEVAFNGAEQVYHKTLDQFSAFFSPCGFRRGAFLPCYGLAEATLMVTGGPKARTPLIKELPSPVPDQYHSILPPGQRENNRKLVSCGLNIPEQQLRIVNVETLMPCPPEQVGEIWLRGPSIASGYWNKAVESELTFGAQLAGSNEGPFLRTGDLGFLDEGELYITGRLKDLVISNGNNHYANDIERSVENSHPAIRPASCAAFSINSAERERIIILAEVEHQLYMREEEDILKAIRNAVAVHHDLQVDDIRLTVAGGIPRTPSGKIKRYLCKTKYMSGTLKEITTV